LDELRGVLDDAMKVAVGAFQTIAKTGGAWAYYGEDSGPVEGEDQALLADLRRCRNELQAYFWRLTLRLGTSHPVVLAWDPVFRRTQEALELFSTHPAERGSLEDRQSIAQGHSRAFSRAQQAFMERANQLVGSRLTDFD
jgi:hypothetical protein